MSPAKRTPDAVAPPRAMANGGGVVQERELRAQGRKTMRKLLDAGMVVFDRRGYHAARVDDIVEVARTSHGTFYLYFANKDDLFRALLTDVAEALVALSRDLPVVAPTSEGHAALRAWLGRFVDLYRDSAPVIRAWTEAEIDDSVLGDLGEDVLRGFTRELTKKLGSTTTTADLRADIAALALVAMIERFNYYVHARRIDADREAMLDTLTSILFVGVFGGPRAAVVATAATGTGRGRTS
jgi:AcrR family transcriptional regulator